MPGTPGYRVSRPTNKEQYISMAEQSLYQLGIGMLLYLVKHSRPYIAYAMHECTKVLDAGTTTYAYHKMLQIIKYVLDTKGYGLRIDPTYKKISLGIQCVIQTVTMQEIVIQDEVYQDSFCMYASYLSLGDLRISNALLY